MGWFRIDQRLVLDAARARIQELPKRPDDEEVARCQSDLEALLAGVRLAPRSTVDRLMIVIRSQLRAGNHQGALRSLDHAIPEWVPGPARRALRLALETALVVGGIIALGVWLWRWPWSVVWVVTALFGVIGLVVVVAVLYSWRLGRANPHWKEGSRLCDEVKVLAGAGKPRAALERYRVLRELAAAHPTEKVLRGYRTAAAYALLGKLAGQDEETRRMIEDDLEAGR